MKIIKSIKAMQRLVKQWKREDGLVGFVPTMGNLHDGHLSLVKSAKNRSDKVVVSIFVNPTQFENKAEVGFYPRTQKQDIEKLEALGVDALYLPTSKAIYPNGEETTFVDVPGISNILDGASRPGHFSGVTTVVSKLFNIVQPDLAVFGKKDFQQLMIIKQLVVDMHIPVKIYGLATKRDKDGLAMSSRNGYLSEEQREQAPYLYQVLNEVKDELKKGILSFQSIRQRALRKLNSKGFKAEYVEIREATSLIEAKQGDQDIVILGAAWLGKARLIDNISVIINAH